MRPRKEIDVNEDNLEDLLACDDIFLDYFNAFLASAAFSIPLKFNRLTGTLVKVNEEKSLEHLGTTSQNLPSKKRNQLLSAEPEYGANEQQREAILNWVKNERLVFFLQTKYYLEYKLCRYLIRPLQPVTESSMRSGSTMGMGRTKNRCSTRYSLRLGGVSRSDEISSADSLAGNKSGTSNSLYNHDNMYEQLQAGFRYLRPGSRAFSLPVYLAHLRNTINFNPHTLIKENAEEPGCQSKYSNGSRKENLMGTRSQVNPKKGDNAKDLNPNRRSDQRFSGRTDFPYDAEIGTDKRSAKIISKNRHSVEEHPEEDELSDISDVDRHEDELEQGKEEDDSDLEVVDDAIDDQGSCIEFEGEEDEDFMQEADDRVGKNEPEELGVSDQINSLQESKERIFKGQQNMKQFIEFVSGTQGETLIKFWLDCEQFRDDMTQFEDLETDDIQSKIYLHAFRELIDKYCLKLTPETKQNLFCGLGGSSQFSPLIFSKVQYDALKRLRAYWVPRFVIFCQKGFSQNLNGSTNSSLTSNEVYISKNKKDTSKESENENLESIEFFPSLNVARTLCVQPAATWSDIENPLVPWINVLESGKRPDERVKSAQKKSSEEQGILKASEIDLNHFDFSETLQKAMEDQMIECDEIIFCIVKDKQSGGPFQRYLQHLCLSSDNVEETLAFLAQYLYWQDMLDLIEAEYRIGDRLMRLSNAWGIFNKYFNPSSLWAVTREPILIEQLRSSLLMFANSHDVKLKCSHVFRGVTKDVLNQLKHQWVNYAVKDSETLDLSLGMQTASTEDLKEKYRELQSSEQLVGEEEMASKNMQKNKVGKSVASFGDLEVPSLTEKQMKLQKSLQIAQEIEDYRLKQRKMKNLAQKRKKRREQKRKPVLDRSQLDTLTSEKSRAEEKEKMEKKKEKKPVIVVKTLTSVRDFFTADWSYLQKDFVKYCKAYEGFNTFLLFRLFVEIQKYNKLARQSDKVRQFQAQNIYSTYLDAYAPMRVNLPKKYLVKEQMTPEKVHNLEDYLEKTLRVAVKVFYEGYKVLEGMQKKRVSQNDKNSSDKLVDLPTTPPVWVKRRIENGVPSKSAAQQGIRGIPTESDKIVFNKVMTSHGNDSQSKDIISEFKIYLDQYGGEQDLPYMGNSFLFFLEVLKLKDFIHEDQKDDVFLNRKLEALVELYVNCQGSDRKVQIEVSTEDAARMVSQLQHFARVKSGTRVHRLDDVSEFISVADSIQELLLQFWTAFWKKRAEIKSKRRRERRARSLTGQHLDLPNLDDISKDGPEQFQIIFDLPKNKPINNQFGSSISFTLMDGVKWKTYELQDLFGQQITSSKAGLTSSKNLERVDSTKLITF